MLTLLGLLPEESLAIIGMDALVACASNAALAKLALTDVDAQAALAGLQRLHLITTTSDPDDQAKKGVQGMRLRYAFVHPLVRAVACARFKKLSKDEQAKVHTALFDYY